MTPTPFFLQNKGLLGRNGEVGLHIHMALISLLGLMIPSYEPIMTFHWNLCNLQLFAVEMLAKTATTKPNFALIHGLAG